MKSRLVDTIHADYSKDTAVIASSRLVKPSHRPSVKLKYRIKEHMDKISPVDKCSVSHVSSRAEHQGSVFMKQIIDKFGRVSDLKAMRKKHFDDVEGEFFHKEMMQYRISKANESAMMQLSKNSLRLKMQARRHGQLDGFSLAESQSSDIGSVSRIRIDAHKKYHELQDSRAKQVKTSIEINGIKAIGETRSDKRNFSVSKKPAIKVTRSVKDLPVALRFYIKSYRHKVQNRTRYLLRRVLARYYKLNLKPKDVFKLKFRYLIEKYVLILMI